MAVEVRHFTATIPAGTPSSTPVTISIAMPVRVVESIDWRVPNGPVGLMGWRLTMGNVQVLPTSGDLWIVADGEHGTLYPTSELTSGAWQVQGYNTGTNPHSVYLAFHVSPVPPRPSAVRLVPPWLLANYPGIADVGQAAGGPL